MIKIDEKRCPGDHRCPILSICPVGAIKQVGYNVPTIDKEKCIECGKCARFCGMQAITIKKEEI